jgi:hypothetical protein
MLMPIDVAPSPTTAGDFYDRSSTWWLSGYENIMTAFYRASTWADRVNGFSSALPNELIALIICALSPLL